MNEVRVRIAPSPTGYLHVGTARTALFNYLFAKRHHGKFILRIEDTDLDRSQAVYTQNIFDSLSALGLSWDEGPDVGGPVGPYHQSERSEIYREWAQKLVDAGLAYPCYLTEAELDAEREAAKAKQVPYVYSGKCRDPLIREQMSQDPNRKASIRFIIPEDRGEVVVHDAIRGDVHFDSTLIGDFVILKSNGTPSYNFAVVVDDILMKISHVVRGEDHLSNTPKQILLFEAFQKLGMFQRDLPVFAHVGMILAPDRTKLSKRHGATAVSDYIASGYLPEAFRNFLALLGWAPTNGEEIGTLETFAPQFELERIAHNPAIFDTAKLDWLNKVYIRELPLPELLRRARPYLEAFPLSHYPDEKLMLMLDAVREPITMLSELSEAVRYFFGESVDMDPQVVEDVLRNDDARKILDTFETDFLPEVDFSAPEILGERLKSFLQAMKPLKTKTVMWTIRVALTGRTHGADLSTTLYLLGKTLVSTRIRIARGMVAQQSPV